MTSRELDELLWVALRSSTIEWAVNVQICDVIKDNQFLAPRAISRIDERLRKDTPSAVQLALSLLEMLIKNCGMVVCRAINAGVTETLVTIVKKKESWRYGFGRNLHKSGLSEWLPQGVAIGEDKRQQWRQASQKVLEIMQLCVDAFLMHEGALRPIFSAYKQLRQEGYEFPRSSTGVAADLCLVNGAEDSPAYLAGATTAPSAAPAVGPAAVGARSVPVAPAAPVGARSAEDEEEVVRLVVAREDAKERVEQLVQALEDGRDFDPNELEELITLVEDISEVLRSMGVETDAPEAVPPPASASASSTGPVPLAASGQELLITGSAAAEQTEPTHFSGGSYMPPLAPSGPYRDNPSTSDELQLPAEDPLFEAPSHRAGESLLGGRKKKPVGSWSQWAQSMRNLTGSTNTRRLGDGVPRSVYEEIGNDDARPLFH